MNPLARRHRRAAGICALLALAGGGPSLRAQEMRVELELEPEGSMGLGERAVLRLKIEGAGSELDPQPELRLDNLRLAAGPSVSSSVTFSGRGATSNLTLTWLLEPLGVGEARVHSASVRIGGQVFELPDRRVAVLEEAPPERRVDPRRWVRSRGPAALDPSSLGPADERRGGRRRALRSAAVPQVFLRAEVAPPDPYVGQQALYTLYLYTEANVGSIRPQKLPDFKGFWAHAIPQGDPEPEAMGGDLYRFVLLRQAIFARRGGRFEIPPVAATMETKIRDPGVTGSLMPQVHEIARVSNAVTLDVRELPPAPGGFRGAVGQIALAAELDPRELEAGEAATLTVTVSGRGHLGGIPDPELPDLDGIRIFPPQQRSDEAFRGNEVGGSRTWSYVLVPEGPGEWRLPAIEMPYFDPLAGSYRTARAPELALVVAGSARRAPERGQTVELHSIRTAALPMVGGGFRGWPDLRPWLFSLPWGLGLALLWVRRRRGNGRHAAARQELGEGLRAADALASPRQAAARMEEAWRDFLADRWAIARSTPSRRWGELLVERGGDATSARALVELADDLHYLRYAPKLAAAEELRRELRGRSRRLMRGLR